jgi:hypothetical protein
MKRYSGYIEGYYGKLLSWDERRLVCNRMAEQHLNTYVYAPKEDSFHRACWKLPYPSSWIETFRIFVQNAARKGVTVVPCIAPGLSFDYTSISDYATLLKKLSVFADIGSRIVALLMDDIPQTLPRASRGTFASLGQAHAVLLSRLQSDLRKRNPSLGLWFCPTVYTNQFAPEGLACSTYLADLADAIPQQIQVLWTGESVISTTLNKKTLLFISHLFRGNIIIWDNLYANDYCPNRLFAGPYVGRSGSANDVTNGILINPTGMPYTDSLLLGVLAGFNAGLTPAQAWKKAAADACVDNEFSTISRFFASPNSSPVIGTFTKAAISRYRASLHHLIWEWKSPLQREWYPFLYMLDTNLALVEKNRSGDDAQSWIKKKYPSVLSSILLANNRICL